MAEALSRRSGCCVAEKSGGPAFQKVFENLLTADCITHIIRLKELYYSCSTVCVRKRNRGTMVDFSSFKTEAGMPIYLQILYFIERGAVAGTIADGDELPSRRVLSALLGINPNTVQKAFRMLEEEGLIESRSGAKSFMTLDAGKISELRVSLLTADIRGLTGALKRTGIDKAEALRLIDRFWDEEARDEEV